MKNVILITFAIITCFISIAQDLILDAQNNIVSDFEEEDTNLIYLYIEEAFANSTYSKVAPFILNKQNEEYLEEYGEIINNAVFLNSRLRIVNQLHNSKPENLKLSIPVSNRGRNIELLLRK